MDTADDIEGISEQYECVITYIPLSDEVVPEKYFHTEATHVYAIPPDKRQDPILEAEELSTRFNGLRVLVLVPGQAFDASGTRHGRGGGWYDRFLANAPREWKRIGFCYDDQFSAELLTCEAWDEPIDLVYVVNKISDKISIHETHARDNAN